MSDDSHLMEKNSGYLVLYISDLIHKGSYSAVNKRIDLQLLHKLRTSYIRPILEGALKRKPDLEQSLDFILDNKEISSIALGLRGAYLNEHGLTWLRYFNEDKVLKEFNFSQLCQFFYNNHDILISIVESPATINEMVLTDYINKTPIKRKTTIVC